jgi:hydrogenase maturation protease
VNPIPLPSDGPIVIGVGNDFRRDDGAGPAVVELLRGLDGLPEDVRLACCDGEPARMIELWNGARLAIVVDAAAADPGLGAAPGSVLRWDPSTGAADLDLRSEAGGTHALGPGTALRLAQVLGRVPGALVVFAVVGSDFDAGPGLSEPVAVAVKQVAADILVELRPDSVPGRAEGLRP